MPPTPGALQWSEVKNRVANWVMKGNDATALTIAGQAANSAIRRLNTRTWKWTFDYEDLTLVADTQEYAAPSDFKEPRALMRLNGSSQFDGRFQFKDPRSFIQEHPRATQSGAPTIYTVYNAFEFANNVTFDRPPSSTFVGNYPTARLFHYRRLQLYTQDSDTLDAPSEVDEFVIWFARAEVAGQFAPQKVSHARHEAQAVWKDLIRDSLRFHDFAINDYGQGLNLRYL